MKWSTSARVDFYLRVNPNKHRGRKINRTLVIILIEPSSWHTTHTTKAERRADGKTGPAPRRRRVAKTRGCIEGEAPATAGVNRFLFVVPHLIYSHHKLHTEQNVPAPKCRVARRPEEASRERILERREIVRAFVVKSKSRQNFFGGFALCVEMEV